MSESGADTNAAVAEAEKTERPPRETSPERIAPAVEAVLFSSARPVRERDLAELLEAAPAAVPDALELLRGRTEDEGRGIRLEKVAGGWRFVTRPEFDALLRRFHEVTERSRLSLAALETLAIIAYRQPITLPEIQEIRGVNCASVLKTLFEKKLVTTAGKKAVVGTPFLYRTTPDFLDALRLERARRAAASGGPRRRPRRHARGPRDRGADGGSAGHHVEPPDAVEADGGRGRRGRGGVTWPSSASRRSSPRAASPRAARPRSGSARAACASTGAWSRSATAPTRRRIRSRSTTAASARDRAAAPTSC